ncbi:unnamed protein product [Gongylonema pulchrum]|uniref:Uncharacterized protein n=1 Tax=Gongylonema pulchrum TaxID=637853 RepID=A0A183EC76_9BILA|nr:unnamed protein product [Gongylonema pulchrum]
MSHYKAINFSSKKRKIAIIPHTISLPVEMKTPSAGGQFKLFFFAENLHFGEAITVPSRSIIRRYSQEEEGYSNQQDVGSGWKNAGEGWNDCATALGAHRHLRRWQ